MEIQVTREVMNDGFTLGTMSVNGSFFCYTCEDKDRNLEGGGVKIKGYTAIPRGRYKVVVSMSNRFKRRLPELLNVPQFTGVRLHGGNTAEDTEGCVLVGNVRTENGVAQCGSPLSKLIALLENEEGESWVQVV